MAEERSNMALWAIWEAAQPLLSPNLSDAWIRGVTGEIARRVQDTPTCDDIETALIPGLQACGIKAECAVLPTHQALLLQRLRERLRYGVRVPVYAFENDPEASAYDRGLETKAVESVEDETLPEEPPGERTLRREGLVLHVETGGEGRIVWREAPTRSAPTSGSGLIQAEREAGPAEFRATFARMILLRRGAKGSRRANIRDALLRWIAFADAYPERIPTLNPEDAPIRAAAVAFLREIAGRQNDPVPLRLRQAAARFEETTTERRQQAAYPLLREAVLLELRLPARVQEALLSPATRPLDDLERRELIYLARAGTRDVKILAARRLAPECERPEVRSTLRQLRCDSDAWVRAVVVSLPL